MSRKSDSISGKGAADTGELLRMLASLLESLSEDQIEDLIRGSSELRVHKLKRDEIGRVSEVSRVPKYNRVLDDSKFPKILARLQVLTTREAGREVLEEEFPSRASIERFARFLDLPVQRSDKIETLRHRIIESEIGSRLRSEAVQGKRMS